MVSSAIIGKHQRATIVSCGVLHCFRRLLDSLYQQLRRRFLMLASGVLLGVHGSWGGNIVSLSLKTSFKIHTPPTQLDKYKMFPLGVFRFIPPPSPSPLFCYPFPIKASLPTWLSYHFHPVPLFVYLTRSFDLLFCPHIHFRIGLITLKAKLSPINLFIEFVLW